MQNENSGDKESLDDVVKKEFRENYEKGDNYSRFNKFLSKYHDFVQRHRTFSFYKNLIIAGGVFAGTGIIGARAISMFTQSKKIIAPSTIITQYIIGSGTFFTLHGYDNQDVYRDENNKFKYKELGKDAIKLFAGFGVLEGLYIVGKPALHYYLMRKGVESGTASLYADMITAPLYYTLAGAIAKGLKVIKKSKKKDSNPTNS